MSERQIIAVETPFGTAHIVPANEGWFAVYLPWKEPGGNFNPRLGTHAGQFPSEDNARKAIAAAVELRAERLEKR